MPNPIYLESLNNYDTTLNAGKDLFSQFLLAIQQKAQSFLPAPIDYPQPVEYLGASISDTTPFSDLFTDKTKGEAEIIRDEMNTWFIDRFDWFDSVKPDRRKYPTDDTFGSAFTEWQSEQSKWEALRARLWTIAGNIIKGLPSYKKPDGAEILGHKISETSKIHDIFAADISNWLAKSFQELEYAKKQADIDYVQWEIDVKKPDSVYFSDPAEKTKAEKEFQDVKSESKKLLSEIKNEIDAVIVAKTPVLNYPPIEFINIDKTNLNSFIVGLSVFTEKTLKQLKTDAEQEWNEWKKNAPSKPVQQDFPNNTAWQKADDEYTQKFQEAEKLHNDIIKALDDEIAKKQIVFPPLDYNGYTPSDLKNLTKDLVYELNPVLGSLDVNDVQDSIAELPQYINDKIAEIQKLSSDPNITAPEIDKWKKFQVQIEKAMNDAIATHLKLFPSSAPAPSSAPSSASSSTSAPIPPSNVFAYTAQDGNVYGLSDLPSFKSYLAGLKTQKACKAEDNNLTIYTNNEFLKLQPGTKEYQDFNAAFGMFHTAIIDEINAKKSKNKSKNNANTANQNANNPQPAPASTSYQFNPTGYQGGRYILVYKNFHKSDIIDYQKYLRQLPTENDVLTEKLDLDVFLRGSLQEWEAYNQGILSQSDYNKYRTRLLTQIDDFKNVFEDAIDHEIKRRQRNVPPAPKTVPPYNGAGKKQVPDFSPDISYFPKDVAETSETNIHLGGSTGAKMVEDSNGNRFIMKKGNSPEHLKSECYADAFYQAAGIKVPAFKLYDVGGEPVKLSAELKNAKSLDDWWNSAAKKERDEMRNKLRQGYAADVLLGNWDVVGMGADNILVDEKGEPWRIDNGGSLKFRAQGAVKTPESWEKYIDDLFTMTGHGSDIGLNTSTTITKFYGPIRPLELAKEINEQDWTKALSTLPQDERKVVENRLEEIRQLAERGADEEHFGKTKEATDEIVSFSYQLCKDGLRESLPQKLDITASSLYDWDTLGEWFHHGNVQRTLDGKTYDSFGEYIADKMGEEGFNFVRNANKLQGKDSYELVSVSRKLCILKAQGFDCTDPKYKTFDDFAKDIEKEGYYCGLNTSPGSKPYQQRDNFKTQFNNARSNPQAFETQYHAVNQYHAAIQIVLENVKMTNVDPKTRTYILVRTEDDGILQKTPGVVDDPNIGERTYHKTGVCESHVRVKTVSVYGENATVLRAPFSRVYGIWPIERGEVQNGTYYPEDHPQYLGAGENESGVDSHGLPIIFAGRMASVSTCHRLLKQFEQNNPNDVVTGVHSR